MVEVIGPAPSVKGDTRARRYACAKCGRHGTADRMIYSRFTGNRYCANGRECSARARRRKDRERVPA